MKSGNAILQLDVAKVWAELREAINATDADNFPEEEVNCQSNEDSLFSATDDAEMEMYRKQFQIEPLKEFQSKFTSESEFVEIMLIIKDKCTSLCKVLHQGALCESHISKDGSVLLPTEVYTLAKSLIDILEKDKTKEICENFQQSVQDFISIGEQREREVTEFVHYSNQTMSCYINYEKLILEGSRPPPLQINETNIWYNIALNLTMGTLFPLTSVANNVSELLLRIVFGDKEGNSTDWSDENAAPSPLFENGIVNLLFYDLLIPVAYGLGWFVAVLLLTLIYCACASRKKADALKKSPIIALNAILLLLVMAMSAAMITLAFFAVTGSPAMYRGLSNLQENVFPLGDLMFNYSLKTNKQLYQLAAQETDHVLQMYVGGYVYISCENAKNVEERSGLNVITHDDIERIDLFRLANEAIHIVKRAKDEPLNGEDFHLFKSRFRRYAGNAKSVSRILESCKAGKTLYSALGIQESSVYRALKNMLGIRYVRSRRQSNGSSHGNSVEKNHTLDALEKLILQSSVENESCTSLKSRIIGFVKLLHNFKLKAKSGKVLVKRQMQRKLNMLYSHVYRFNEKLQNEVLECDSLLYQLKTFHKAICVDIAIPFNMYWVVVVMWTILAYFAAYLALIIEYSYGENYGKPIDDLESSKVSKKDMSRCDKGERSFGDFSAISRRAAHARKRLSSYASDAAGRMRDRYDRVRRRRHRSDRYDESVDMTEDMKEMTVKFQGHQNAGEEEDTGPGGEVAHTVKGMMIRTGREGEGDTE
ncbi:hypothetical protein D917_00859 [Trichinella nativa]|uniref:Uncharacterized protein n=1 Tax=Trichinella nativa TaxID=6335 RepID=A0A1Y3E3Q4_9BILA|nr:hypothetical protein D917_00859 [Trichinella nativa]